jgi:acetyl-CoA carboxylase biotin carboxyl carrier protein
MGMNLHEIQDLIKFVSKSGVSEVEIEQKDFKIIIKAENKAKKEEHTVYVQAPQAAIQPAAQQPLVSPTPQAAVETPKTETTTSSDESRYITIKSPMIGTFYRSTSPDKPALANVGDAIEKGKVVCIIEAMKLFNDIESEISGKIVKVLVNDATPVEYDQPLFLVDPA